MTTIQMMFFAPAVRFSEERDGQEVGHAYLYIMKNDIHDKPFGYLEDVHVAKRYRKAGIGNELLQAVVVEAKARGCYKLIATSRNDGTREEVHSWYQRLGFELRSMGFRLDL